MAVSEILLKIHTNTKIEEKEIVQQFLQRLEYLPTTINASECPDYEIEINSKLIGIEITKYYSDFTKNGSTRQRKLSEWKKFSEELNKKLSNMDPNYEYLYGAIHFRNDKVNYRELLEDKYFNEINTFIKSINLMGGEQKSKKVSSYKFPFLSSYVDSISLWNKYPDKKHLWWDTSLQSGEVLNNAKAIQEIVDKKEKSAKKYKTDYTQKWLIIYAGGLSLHDIFVFDMPYLIRQGEVLLISKNKKKKLVFDINSEYFTHVFIWDKFTERIYQLFPYLKKIFDYGERKIWINHLPLKE